MQSSKDRKYVLIEAFKNQFLMPIIRGERFLNKILIDNSLSKNKQCLHTSAGRVFHKSLKSE